MSANKIRAVIDTQLFLRAAINRRSLPARIIIDLRNAYDLIASKAILKEAREVLYCPEIREKIPHLSDTIAEQILSVYSSAVMIEPEDIPAISRDPKDDMFLACAKAAGAQYIVSEDKDLLVLNPYEGIQIINALDFLRVIQPPIST